MKKIGISASEIKRRGITLHGWLLDVAIATSIPKYGIADVGFSVPQVQAVTGHKSLNMTNSRYNHPDARSIADVVEAQTEIAGTKEPETKSRIKKGKPEAEKEGVKIIKMHVRKTA
jgi:hypothetical protein